jgi:HSP20 family protein
MALRPPRRGFSVSRRLSERARADQPSDSAAMKDASDLPGVGGIVEALKSMVETLADAAKTASGDGRAEQGFSAGGKDARVVFGYTLRMGADGVSAERFGDVPDSTARPSPEASQPASRQPITDIFEEADAIVVVAELPGADPATVRCTLDGLSLLIVAAGARAYRKSLVLPAAVVPESLQTSFQNGILEVRLARSTRA